MARSGLQETRGALQVDEVELTGHRIDGSEGIQVTVWDWLLPFGIDELATTSLGYWGIRCGSVVSLALVSLYQWVRKYAGVPELELEAAIKVYVERRSQLKVLL